MHFLTADLAGEKDSMIVLCWHAAGEVEDVHLKWEETSEAELDAISPKWREFMGTGGADEL